MPTFRPGFVLEQTLGHVTHAVNLKSFLNETDGVSPAWIDVPFRPDALQYRMPPVAQNWSLRGSLFARDALRAPRSSRYDALFVHTATISLLAGSVYDAVPTVISLDATPLNIDEVSMGYAHKVMPAPLEKLKQNMLRRVLKKAKAYVSWSEWAKTSMVNDYGVDGSRVHVITPGTNLDLFASPPRSSGKLVRILFVGGDFQRKGGDLLLNVFRRRLRGKAELHLVTGAELAPEENVFVYRGLTANSDQLLNLYRTADILALPTRADCLAVVLGEAMAASLPIVTTTVGAHGEAVETGNNGFAIAPDDEPALAAALEALVEDAGLRRRMGEAGRQRAEERFDARKNAKQILGLLEGFA